MTSKWPGGDNAGILIAPSLHSDARENPTDQGAVRHGFAVGCRRSGQGSGGIPLGTPAVAAIDSVNVAEKQFARLSRAPTEYGRALEFRRGRYVEHRASRGGGGGYHSTDSLLRSARGLANLPTKVTIRHLPHHVFYCPFRQQTVEVKGVVRRLERDPRRLRREKVPETDRRDRR